MDRKRQNEEPSIPGLPVESYVFFIMDVYGLGPAPEFGVQDVYGLESARESGIQDSRFSASVFMKAALGLQSLKVKIIGAFPVESHKRFFLN